MPTRMNFNLSPQLQTSLGLGGGANNGVYVYAVAYEGSPSSFTTSATLWSHGAAQATYITLPSPNFPNGVVYVVVEQAGAGNPSAVAGLLSSQSNISPANAALHNFTYQLFEATMDGNSADLGDISAVNSFGLTSTFEVVYNPGPDQTTESRGFRTSGSAIFQAVETAAGNPAAVHTFSPNVFPNSDALAVGPAATANSSPWNSSVWHQYVTNLKTYPALGDIQLVSIGQGVVSHYGLEYVANDRYGTDYFWLRPNLNHGGTNTDWMRIPAADLERAIYVQTVNLEVHQGGRDGPIVSGPGFTPNTPSGSIARDLVAGLDAGFFGASGSSPNPLVTGRIDLNHNSNWTTNYSYGGTLNPAGTAITYSNVLDTGPGPPGHPNSYYDAYAQAIQSRSNAYGYSYGDLLSRGSTNPQISMWDPVLGTNVQQINISLYDTNETPPAGAYAPYTAPYVAPPVGGYRSVLTPTGHGATPPPSGNVLQFGFQFGVGGATLGPNDGTPIEFRFYAPNSHHAGNDGFVTLHINDATTTPREYGDWYNFNMVNTPGPGGGTWSLSPFSNTTVPQFNIYGVPVTGDGTTSWYQVVFGAAGSQTVYNIYAASDAATDQITGLVVDHAVAVSQLAPNQGWSNWHLDFADGGNLTYNIRTLSVPYTDGDINGDGRADLTFQNGISGNVAAWQMNGLTVLESGVFAPAPTTAWRLGAIADINHDGRADYIYQSRSTGHLAAWELDGLSILASGAASVSPTTVWQLRTTGDFNGDGNADLVFQAPSGDVAIWQMSGFNIVSARVLAASPGPTWQVRAVGDVSGDGNSDIIFQNSGSGDIALWEMRGTTIVRGGVVEAHPTTVWQLRGAGDLNGDNHADLIFQATTSGDVAAWQMDWLTISASAVLPGSPTTAWQLGNIGDFNGDLRADLAFQHTGSGNVAIWEMNGTSITRSAVLPPEPGTDWDLLA